MAVTDMITETQDRMLTEFQAGQQRLIDFNKQMAEAVQGFIPTQFFDEESLPSLPAMDELPKPAEIVDGYFDFATKVADANRAFYKELIEVWTPAE
jgi:hypothetical protein